MSRIELSIEQLQLDTANPRLGDPSAQRDALQEVIDDQGPKLAVLAESIVERGLSPMDRLLVLRESPGSDRYVALEGNRRVAALRILLSPSALDGLKIPKAIQQRLEAASRRFDRRRVEPIDCSLQKTRSDARHWIALRHTGENEGEGVVPWSGVARNRFRGEDFVTDALDFVARVGGLDEDSLKKLGGRFPISTLRRLLETPDVREKLGLRVENDRLIAVVPPKEALKPLRRIVTDLISGDLDARKLNKKQQQIRYVEELGKDKPDLAKRVPAQRVADIQSLETPSRAPKIKQAIRKSPSPAERKTLIPRDAHLNISDTKIAQLGKELRSLWMEDYPHAVAVLLRVFLELSVDHYMDKHKMPTTVKNKGGHENFKNLKSKVDEVVTHLVAQGKPAKSFNDVRRAMHDQASPLNFELLNDYVHNRFTVPTRDKLIKAWSAAQPLVESIWP